MKVQLPTVDNRNIGATRQLELAERSARRLCRSATVLDLYHFIIVCIVFIVDKIVLVLVKRLQVVEALRAENQRLRDENGALIRVISKLSKS